MYLNCSQLICIQVEFLQISELGEILNFSNKIAVEKQPAKVLQIFKALDFLEAGNVLKFVTK